MITDKDRESAKRLAYTLERFGFDDFVKDYSNEISESAEQAKAEERATIMSEIANGGKSCHWCIEENRRIGAEQARKEHEKETLDAIRERDDAENFIDKLLDLLEVEHEWSNVFGRDDAYREAEASIDQIRSISAYEARQQARKEAAERGISFMQDRLVPGVFTDIMLDEMRAAILSTVKDSLTVAHVSTDDEKLAIAVKALEDIIAVNSFRIFQVEFVSLLNRIIFLSYLFYTYQIYFKSYFAS